MKGKEIILLGRKKRMNGGVGNGRKNRRKKKLGRQKLGKK